MEKLFELLESPEAGVVEDVKCLIDQQLSGGRNDGTDANWLFDALLTYYVDSKSHRTLLILSGIRNSYADYLLHRLSERLDRVPSKSNGSKVSDEHDEVNQRLEYLLVLSQLICSNPPWVSKIPRHALMKKIMQLMHNEDDPATIMCLLLCVSLLLPLAPMEMTSCIKDVFLCFARIARWLGLKPTHVPDVLAVHLFAALTALFHRLYALFPCNFLEFLRRHFGPVAMTTISPSDPNNVFNPQGVFNTVILPMLSSVRLHHLFITASSATEMNPTRWRKKEQHDILIDIAKVTLDPMESASQGFPLEFIKKVVGNLDDSNVSFLTKSARTTMITTTTTVVKTISEAQTTQFNVSPSCHSSSNGLSTVPRGVAPFLSDPSSSSSLLPLAKPPALTTDLKWCPAVVCGLTTPPPPETKSIRPTIDEVDVTPVSPPLVVEVTDMTRVMALDSIKVEEETKESRRGSTDVVANEEKASEPTQSKEKSSSLKTETGGRKKSLTISYSAPEIAVVASTINQIAEGVAASSLIAKDDRKSTFELPLVDDDDDDDDDLDEEVSIIVGNGIGDSFNRTTDDLTGGDFELSEAEDTGVEMNIERDADVDPEAVEKSRKTGESANESQSVKKFMQNVNRIRFNSLSDARNMSTATRPQSCPPLYKIHEDIDVDEDSKEVDDKAKTEGSYNDANFSLEGALECPKCRRRLISDGGSTVDSVEGRASRTRKLSSQSGHAAATLLPKNPWDSIWPYVSLPKEEACLGKMGVNEGAVEVSGDELEGSSEHPVEDVYVPNTNVSIKSRMHAFDSWKKLPLSSRDKINWTHFGGQPPTDEINILKTRLKLAQNETIFERQKRQLHARRNRDMLGRIVKAMALEQSNIAMKDQLKQQEAESAKLRESLIESQRQLTSRRDVLDKRVQQLSEENRSLLDEKQKLERLKRLLESNLETAKSDLLARDSLLNKMKQVHFEILEDSKSYEEAAKKVPTLEKQLNRANNELILHGELQLKYQHRLSEMELIHSEPVAEMEIKQTSMKQELNSLRYQRDALASSAESTKSRVIELEQLLAFNEEAIAELKGGLDRMRHHKIEADVATERRYQTSLRANQRLESGILELKAQLYAQNPPATPLKKPPQMNGDSASPKSAFSPDITVSPTVPTGEIIPRRNVRPFTLPAPLPVGSNALASSSNLSPLRASEQGGIARLRSSSPVTPRRTPEVSGLSEDWPSPSKSGK